MASSAGRNSQPNFLAVSEFGDELAFYRMIRLPVGKGRVFNGAARRPSLRLEVSAAVEQSALESRLKRLFYAGLLLTS